MIFMPRSGKLFDFPPGRRIGKHYTVVSLLGWGSEGEVYRIREERTGILRAAKVYYADALPKRNPSIQHAQKLYKIRQCPIVLQYHHSEEITVRKERVIVMISELCEGIPLERWVKGHRGKRVSPFVAMHILYQLACGLEDIHSMNEYHSDVHTENILIHPRGMNFELKLIDFYDWGKPNQTKMKQDIVDAVRVFYDILGGQKHYPKMPDEVKKICFGLQQSRILYNFPNITALRYHLETFESTTKGWQ